MFVLVWVVGGLIVLLVSLVWRRILLRARQTRVEHDRLITRHDDPFERTSEELPDLVGSTVARKTTTERLAARRRPARTDHTGHPTRRWLIIGAVVVLLAVSAGIVWPRHNHHTPVAAAPHCPPATLRVAAAPEIAAVVEAAAETLSTHATCDSIEVSAEDPAVTEAAPRKPDVWIPSSSAWLGIAATDGAAYTTMGAPLARSPIVLAAPASMAALYAKNGQTSWAAVTNGAATHQIPVVTMPDPLHSTIGLLSVYAEHAAMDRTTTDTGIAQLRALTLRSRLKDASADPATLMQQEAAETDPVAAARDIGVFPITEQQLTAYAQGQHPVALIGAIPADGIIDADYPYAVATASTHQDLAQRLRAAISPAALTTAGFQTDPTSHALALPTNVNDLLAPALAWSQYRTLNFQVLVMIDASGSMNDPITDVAGHATTKAALLRQTGLGAAQLFGEDTSIGLWLFSTPAASSPAHVQEIPLGPITGSIGGQPRRTVLATKISGYQAGVSAGTPLYQSVLDGEATMRAQAKVGTITLVVVLTDGKDQGSRFAMSTTAFLTKLKASEDPSRPVPIIAVGYGADADMGALTAMATATGGKAVAAKNPADLASAMAQAFLAAHAPN